MFIEGILIIPLSSLNHTGNESLLKTTHNKTHHNTFFIISPDLLLYLIKYLHEQ